MNFLSCWWVLFVCWFGLLLLSLLGFFNEEGLMGHRCSRGEPVANWCWGEYIRFLPSFLPSGGGCGVWGVGVCVHLLLVA